MDLPATTPTTWARGLTDPAGPDPQGNGVVGYAEVAVDSVRPNPRQPRQVFDEDALAELVSSIDQVGLLQPIVVRPGARPDEFELVAGERRLRAVRSLGMQTIPAVIRPTKDDNLLREALLENLHRAALNPLEEAAAYQQLLTDFACTQEELATRLGRSRPQISNTIRLLKLPAGVQRRLAAGVLSHGHARALLALGDPVAMEALAARIVAEGLSVRSVEEIVALGGGPGPERPRRRSRRSESAAGLQTYAEDLSDRLDTRVHVTMGRSKGKVTIEFAGVDDLDRILTLIHGPGMGHGDRTPGDVPPTRG